MLEGQTAELKCSATGDPTPVVRLTGDPPFSGMKGVPGRVTGIFSPVTPAHAGTYFCRASNDAAVIEQRVQLEVVPISSAIPPVIHQPNKAVLW